MFSHRAIQGSDRMLLAVVAASSIRVLGASDKSSIPTLLVDFRSLLRPQSFRVITTRNKRE